jgi:hypothetical protein
MIHLSIHLSRLRNQHLYLSFKFKPAAGADLRASYCCCCFCFDFKFTGKPLPLAVGAASANVSGASSLRLSPSCPTGKTPQALLIRSSLASGAPAVGQSQAHFRLEAEPPPPLRVGGGGAMVRGVYLESPNDHAHHDWPLSLTAGPPQWRPRSLLPVGP